MERSFTAPLHYFLQLAIFMSTFFSICFSEQIMNSAVGIKVDGYVTVLSLGSFFPYGHWINPGNSDLIETYRERFSRIYFIFFICW